MYPAANSVTEYRSEKSSGSYQKNVQHVLSNLPSRQKQKNPYLNTK